MSISIESIIARMEWAARRHLDEFACLEDGHRITIRRGQSALTASPAPIASLPCEPAADTQGYDVPAPLAGLCHLRPEAGGDAFVQPGAQVTEGQTICIIEAMKMMTPIPAPRSGTLDAILVQDGATVAAGDSLVRIS
ncbi:acetyl-CoA carboxylase biotin carboxyl carrier protein [Paracoccus sp. R86501]|uniref:acetyl-CoA carboxylase biotin carboxyl carrier protein n=1 Tax=Paracoccus sp. R86501 TaxID=3101711 RepID=UPI003672D09B